MQDGDAVNTEGLALVKLHQNTAIQQQLQPASIGDAGGDIPHTGHGAGTVHFTTLTEPFTVTGGGTTDQRGSRRSDSIAFVDHAYLTILEENEHEIMKPESLPASIPSITFQICSSGIAFISKAGVVSSL